MTLHKFVRKAYENVVAAAEQHQHQRRAHTEKEQERKGTTDEISVDVEVNANKIEMIRYRVRDTKCDMLLFLYELARSHIESSCNKNW